MVPESGSATAGLDVRRYVRLLRRHALLVVVLTLVLGIGAYAYSARKAPTYESTAQLLYSPQVNVNDPLNENYVDPTTQELALQNAVTIITGPTIGKAVATQLKNAAAVPGFSVSAAVTTSDVNASTPIDNGVAVTVDSTSALWAATLANEYGQAFASYSTTNEIAKLQSAIAAVATQMKMVSPASAAYASYLSDYQELQILVATTKNSGGDFSLAMPAVASGVPISPKPKRSAAIGAILGLVLGIAIAFLIEKLDTRLHDRHQVAQITNMPLLGRIGRISSEALAKSPLVVLTEADSRAAEAIRMLRSNLQFASLGEENRVLMVTSPLKSEGKSLLSANLAASLALAGSRTVLVDADLRRPRVSSIFNVPNTHGVSTVIAGLSTLDEALQTYEIDSGGRTLKVRGNGNRPEVLDAAAPSPLALLTSGPIPPNPGEMVASRRFAEIIHELVERGYDHVLIDSPAFLAVGDTAALASATDGILLLVNLKLDTRTTLDEACDFLEQLPPRKLGVITNMDGSGKGDHYYYHYRQST